jgi:hypothetical protein
MHGEFVVADDCVFGRELLFNECDLRFEGLDFEMGLFGLGEFLLLLVKSLLSFYGILFHGGKLFSQTGNGFDVLVVFLENGFHGLELLFQVFLMFGQLVNSVLIQKVLEGFGS